MSHPLLEIRHEVWDRLFADLARTGSGTRESGAFLMGASDQRRVVTDYLLYDEVTPESQHVDYVLLRGPIWPGYGKRASDADSSLLQMCTRIPAHPRKVEAIASTRSSAFPATLLLLSPGLLKVA